MTRARALAVLALAGVVLVPTRGGEHVSGRFGAPLRIILARRGDVDLVHAELEPQVELVEGAAVEALVEASETTDLPVVGSRGLHRLRALGSVSERVAHKARPSVPVVRSRAMG